MARRCHDVEPLPERGPFVGGVFRVLRGRAWMDSPSYATARCVSAVARSNPVKEGCFFFKNMYEKPLCFPAGIPTVHRKSVVFLSFQVPALGCLAFMDFLG